MTLIHITDASKASLVMTSEVFKDKIQGSVVLCASNGKDTLQYFMNFDATKKMPDMCIVDFDLPDTDGITLIRELRKVYSGPILLTAYPDKVVGEAVNEELFAFNDSGAWIPKPVRFEELEKRIDQFLISKYRLGRRFDVNMNTNLVGKGAGRGKRAPKVEGKIVNISLGGVCVEVDSAKFKLKDGQEYSFAINLSPKAKKSTLAKGEVIKGKVAWIKGNGKLIGLEFSKITDLQKRGLETFLKGLI